MKLNKSAEAVIEKILFKKTIEGLVQLHWNCNTLEWEELILHSVSMFV